MTQTELCFDEDRYKRESEYIEECRREVAEMCPKMPWAGPPLLRFDGDDIQHERDSPRLTTQFEAIKNLMMDGQWYTYDMIDIRTGYRYPQSSISAQIRHMRKPEQGSYTVERRYIGNGLYEYRLDPESGKVKQ